MAREGADEGLRALREPHVQRCRLALLQDRRGLAADREVVRQLAGVLDQEPRQAWLDLGHALAARGLEDDLELRQRHTQGGVRLAGGGAAAATATAGGDADAERAL